MENDISNAAKGFIWTTEVVCGGGCIVVILFLIIGYFFPSPSTLDEMKGDEQEFNFINPTITSQKKQPELTPNEEIGFVSGPRTSSNDKQPGLSLVVSGANAQAIKILEDLNYLVKEVEVARDAARSQHWAQCTLDITDRLLVGDCWCQETKIVTATRDLVGLKTIVLTIEDIARRCRIPNEPEYRL